jgi:hypothetical protein
MVYRERSRGREWLFGFASLEFPGLMQIARAMMVQFVFNRRIACVDVRIVMHDRVSALTAHTYARRVWWGWF